MLFYLVFLLNFSEFSLAVNFSVGDNFEINGRTGENPKQYVLCIYV